MQDLDELLDNLTILTERSLVHDHRRITVQAMTFGKARIIIGKPVPHTDTYYDLEDGWCYLSHKAALDALDAWDPEKDKEPDGWMRHVGTNRYRIDGRVDLEYVKDWPGDSLEDNVAYAIKATHRGEGVVITTIRKAESNFAAELPPGTQYFDVFSRISGKPCASAVYHYLDRSVVVDVASPYVAVADIRRRLTRDNGELPKLRLAEKLEGNGAT